MLSCTTAGQDVQIVFAFKKAPVEVFLIARDETIADRDVGFAVEHSMTDEKDSGLKSLLSYFTLLGLGKQEVEHHPIPNNAKRLPLELLTRQLNKLVISKPGTAKYPAWAVNQILNQLSFHAVA